MAFEAGFNAIVDRFAESVYNHAWRMLGSPEDAEEATQDVFLRVHGSLDSFRGDAKISTWIWRITTNVCLSRRSAKRDSMKRSENLSGSDDVPDDSRGPEAAYIESEERERLGRLIATLPDGEASAITLYYMQGFDYNEIAEVLCIPPGSVATALHRGRDRLRSMLEGTTRQVKE